MSIPLTLNFVAICIGIYILKSYISKRASNPSSLPYPPGPKPKPIVGSLLDLPKEESWKTYASWGKEYGDLIHFTVLGKHFIVLNSSRVATDLLERRAHKYSDKPVTPTLSMSDWLWAFSNMPYGEKWRRYRREFHQQFRAEKNRNYRPIMSQRARQLLRNLAGNPEQFVSYLRHYAAAVIMSIAYDYDVASQDDRFVYIAEAAVNMLGHCTFPGATIVNTLPFLRHLPGWLPGMGVKRYTEECRKLTLEMRHAPLELVRKRMASGVPSDCVAANLIDRFSARGGTLEENEETITDVAAMAYAAGADTTVSALTTAFLAMTLYPEARMKAQAEIDKVIGTSRLPGFEDKDSLPYLEAFIREVFRWRPVAPLSIPHVVMEDDVYEGYFIPKGTIVNTNLWAMQQEESMFGDEPEKFKPERFLNPDGSLNDRFPDATFGLGRRSCAGRHTGFDTVWVGIAHVLAAFDVSKAKDEAGNEIDVVEKYVDALVSHPLPFACSIMPRSRHAETLINELLPLAAADEVKI